MKKRILTMLLALAMIVSLVPVAAMATECDHTYDQYTPTTFGKHNLECSKCGDILVASAHRTYTPRVLPRCISESNVNKLKTS